MTPLSAARDALAWFKAVADQYDGIPPAKYFGDTDCELRYPETLKIEVPLSRFRSARSAHEALNQRTPPPGESEVRELFGKAVRDLVFTYEALKTGTPVVSLGQWRRLADYEAALCQREVR